MTMQWVFGQVADHGKQGQLPQVEQGFTREASSKEENNGAWCLWVESLNVLQCGLLRTKEARPENSTGVQ